MGCVVFLVNPYIFLGFLIVFVHPVFSVTVSREEGRVEEEAVLRIFLGNPDSESAFTIGSTHRDNAQTVPPYEVVIASSLITHLTNPLAADFNYVRSEVAFEFCSTAALDVAFLIVVCVSIVLVEDRINLGRARSTRHTGSFPESADGEVPVSVTQDAAVEFGLRLCIVEKDFGITEDRNGVTAFCNVELVLFLDIVLDEIVAGRGEGARHILVRSGSVVCLVGPAHVVDRCIQTRVAAVVCSKFFKQGNLVCLHRGSVNLEELVDIVLCRRRSNGVRSAEVRSKRVGNGVGLVGGVFSYPDHFRIAVKLFRNEVRSIIAVEFELAGVDDHFACPYADFKQRPPVSVLIGPWSHGGAVHVVVFPEGSLVKGNLGKISCCNPLVNLRLVAVVSKAVLNSELEVLDTFVYDKLAIVPWGIEHK